MAVVLALLSALSYGTSDFIAGVASRRYTAGAITGAMQGLGALTAVAAILLFPGAGPHPSALEWGAISGVGSAIGTLALYYGLAASPMSAVVAVGGVVTAVVPVVVGVILGNRIGVGAWIGIGIAIPAIALVSYQPGGEGQGGIRAGAAYGALAGLGFALLFIALDRAGTYAGAWPILPGQLVSLVIVAPVAYRDVRASGLPSSGVVPLIVVAAVISAAANLLFLAATGHGVLAIVAVLTALYPGVTLILARVVLSERWTRLQAGGLVIAAAAIVLVSA